MVALGLGARFREMKPARSTELERRGRSSGAAQWLQRKLVVGALLPPFLAMGLFSRRPAHWVSSIVGALLSPFLRAKQLANYTALFPQFTPGKIRDLRRGHQQYHTRLRVQLARLYARPVESLREEVEWKGEENLRAALAGGCGVLLVGAHMGTWCHVPLRASLSGVKCRSIMNPLLGPPVWEWMIEISRRFSVPLTPVNEGAYSAARDAFRRNEVFYIAMDFSLRLKRSLHLPLEGCLLPVDPGPALLALRHRPAVLWVTCHHDSEGRSTVELFPPMAIGHGTPLDTPEALCQEWTRRLEQDVKRWPEQWWPTSFSTLASNGRLITKPPAQAPHPAQQ